MVAMESPPRLPRPTILSHGDIRLEPMALSHVTGLHVALDDPSVWQWLRDKQPVDEIAMGAIVVAALEQRDGGIRVPFVISVAGTVAGTTSYFDSDPFSSGIEIGASFIGTPWWRSNVNTTAKLLMLGHAFEVYGYERILLKTDVANERSSKAIARLGASKEGVLRHHMKRPDGSWRDSVVFSILLDEWPSVKDKLESALAKHAVAPQ